MTREEAKKLLPFIQAFSEGKTIQWLTGSGEWYDVVGNDTIDFEFLADRKTEYRIKPEFKDGDILYATDWISGYIYINKEPESNIDICYCYKLSGEDICIYVIWRIDTIVLFHQLLLKKKKQGLQQNLRSSNSLML